VLGVVQLLVQAVARHQALVGAELGDPPVVDHEDEVGVADGRERWATMNVVRPSMSRSSASRMTVSVRESIDEVGSSRMSSGASLRKARATEMRWRSPPESSAPALAELGLVAVGQRGDEVVRVGRAGRREDLLVGRLQAPVADVVEDARAEQQRLLQDDAELLAHRRDGEVAQVVPVERDAPVLGVVEARQQVEQRALARAGGADDRHAVARLDGEVTLRSVPGRRW
jgi:hypothetical protein